MSFLGIGNKLASIGLAPVTGGASLLPGATDYIPILGDLNAKDKAKKNAEQYANSFGAIDQQLYGTMQLPNLTDQGLPGLDAQRQALSSLQARMNGGLTATDRNALNQIKTNTNRNALAQRQAVLQDARSRGMATGGQVLSAQLAGGDAAAERAQQFGLGVGDIASQRGLQATQAAGALGGQMAAFNAAQKAMDFQNRMQLAAQRQGLMGGAAQALYAGQQQQQAIDAGIRNQIAQLGMAAATGGFSGFGGAQTPARTYDPLSQYNWRDASKLTAKNPYG